MIAAPLYVGIDPGKKGAIAFFAPYQGVLEIHPMPSIISHTAMLMDQHAPRIKVAVTEKVHSMPGNGASSMFTFGFGAGAMAGICAAYHINLVALDPGVWKTIMGLSSDKKRSLELARTKFPGHTHLFRRVKDNDAAEAALMAWLAADRFHK